MCFFSFAVGLGLHALLYPRGPRVSERHFFWQNQSCLQDIYANGWELADMVLRKPVGKIYSFMELKGRAPNNLVPWGEWQKTDEGLPVFSPRLGKQGCTTAPNSTNKDKMAPCGRWPFAHSHLTANERAWDSSCRSTHQALFPKISLWTLHFDQQASSGSLAQSMARGQMITAACATSLWGEHGTPKEADIQKLDSTWRLLQDSLLPSLFPPVLAVAVTLVVPIHHSEWHKCGLWYSSGTSLF